MINFEEELNRFQKAPELDDAEKIIRTGVCADLKDVIIEARTLTQEQTEENKNADNGG